MEANELAQYNVEANELAQYNVSLVFSRNQGTNETMFFSRKQCVTGGFQQESRVEICYRYHLFSSRIAKVYGTV
jgi:hypothetical protein